MKQFSKDLGNVSLAPKGRWSKEQEYERLNLVYNACDNLSYVAKIDVPIGVEIDNREYWQPMNATGYADNNFINLTTESETGTVTAYESLEEAVATILPINRRPGATLSFFNLNADRLDRQAEFELWQFNSTDLANWEIRDYWNNIYYNWNVFAGWYVGADGLKNHVKIPNVGQYAYVGTNLNDALLYQCRTNGTWTNTGIKVRNYISVVVGGNITIGENGNWFSDGKDTGIPATPAVDEQLDNIIMQLQHHTTEISNLKKSDANLQDQITSNDSDITNLTTKHESLSRTVQGIAATGGASTANNVTYNNDTSGLNAENAQDAIDELQASKIDKTSILQESGEAEDKVMSQKATTDVISELEMNLDEFATLLFLSTLKLKIGAISISGSNVSSTTQLRPDDSIYIKGRYILRLPNGYVFRRICFYDKESKALLKYIDPDESKGNIATIGIYNDVDCLTRFTIKKTDNSNIEPSDIVYRSYSDILNDYVNDENSKLQNSINSNFLDFLSFVDYSTEAYPLVVGKTMSTGNNVGEIAAFTENLVGGWRYIKLLVEAGETYFIRGAVGGIAPRAVTITDTTGKILDIKPTEFTGILHITVNGFLVVNGTADSKIKVSVIDSYNIKNNTLNILDTVGLFQGGITTSGIINPDNLNMIYSGKIIKNAELIMPDGFSIGRVVYYNNVTGEFDSFIDINSVSASVGKSGCYARISIVKNDKSQILTTDFPIINTAAFIDSVDKNNTLNILDSVGLFQGGLTISGVITTNASQIYSGKINESVKLIMPDGFLIRRIVYYNLKTDTFNSSIERNNIAAIVGKKNCYARISIVSNDGSSISPNDFPVNNLGGTVQNTKDLVAYFPPLSFDSDYDFADSFESELEDMQNSLAKNTVPSDYMDKIYQKIDNLIENNPDYITKYDAVELANAEGLNISYPIYARGIVNPITETVTLSNQTYDVTYDTTPEYKTYIYKLSNVKDGLYGNNIKKKTIFITACTHGWEKAGSFNTYLLMKRLCEDYIKSDFYMKLRSLFDIWIIPCLNGYGIYHGTRTNARLVNINRNAPSNGWHVIGSPGHKDWSGEPNSEFETKLVVHFIDTLKPDIYFDHHNFTPDDAMISFTSGISKRPCNSYFRALVDFTRCAMKHLPQYFGTKFNIIQTADPNYYPNGSAADLGELHCYAYNKGIDFAFVLEVDYAIPFKNGEYTGFNNLVTNSNDTYRLNEYILRSQLLHYCNAVLQQ